MRCRLRPRQKALSGLKSALIIGSRQGMDVVRLAGQADAESAEVLFERFAGLFGIPAASYQLLVNRFDASPNRRQIEVWKTALPEDDLAVDQDTVDGAAVFRMDQLIRRIVQGQKIHMVQIEEDDIGFVPRRQTAHIIPKAQGFGTTLGGHAEHLVGLQPVVIIMTPHP